MIPVVLIHKGASSRYPLQTVIDHARRFGNTVHLLHDAPDAEFALDDFWGGAGFFEEHYVHLSGNHAEFERFCIQRWFLLRDYMRYARLERCLYTDSDVLLYCHAENEWPRWGEGYALTLALGTSAATSYWTMAGLEAFCDFVLSVYVSRNQYFREFERIYREMQAQGLPGGISDMALLKTFKREVTHVRVGEMTEVREGATWDHNFNASDGYMMEHGHKYIVMSPSGRPQGFSETSRAAFPMSNPTYFNALHFQGGGGKRLLKQYLGLVPPGN